MIGAEVRDSGRAHHAAFSEVDTTEVRWFFDGPLPRDIRAWFTGSSGVAEDRCDSYLLGGRGDVGIKRRFGETLEFKVRQSLAGRVDLGGGLAGQLELWRKWSPADTLVDDSDGRWIDVHKSVVKRRFTTDGAEVAFSWDRPQVIDAGCDVEIAEVTVDAAHSWTLALAAFGPTAVRRDAILAAWQRLTAGSSWPERFRAGAGRARGYPDWLGGTVPELSTTGDPVGK